MRIRSERIRADLLLMGVAIIWGSAFVVQRIAGQAMSFFAFNGFRFILGSLILAPFAWKGFNFTTLPPLAELRKELTMPLIAGAVLAIAAALQQAGLEHTTAGNAGFFTSLYVIIVPFLLSFFWRHRILWQTWAAGGVAVLGAGLLSTAGLQFRLAPGDGLELLGAFFWALHVILVGKAVRQLDVLQFSAAQYAIAGLLNLAFGWAQTGDLAHGLSQAWWTILFIGVISTALGYTLQAKAQQHAPPADASILLSLEAVFAAMFGWLILGEELATVQLLGCSLIIGGVLLAQLPRSPDTIQSHGQE